MKRKYISSFNLVIAFLFLFLLDYLHLHERTFAWNGFAVAFFIVLGFLTIVCFCKNLLSRKIYYYTFLIIIFVMCLFVFEMILIGHESHISSWYLQKKAEEINSASQVMFEIGQQSTKQLCTATTNILNQTNIDYISLEVELEKTLKDLSSWGPCWITVYEKNNEPLIWKTTDTQLPPFISKANYLDQGIDKNFIIHVGPIFISMFFIQTIQSADVTVVVGFVIDYRDLDHQPLYPKSFFPAFRTQLGDTISLYLPWNIALSRNESNHNPATNSMKQILPWPAHPTLTYNLSWQANSLLRTIQLMRKLRMTLDLICILILVFGLVSTLMKNDSFSDRLDIVGYVILTMSIAALFALFHKYPVNGYFENIIPQPVSTSLISSLPIWIKFLYSLLIAISLSLIISGNSARKKMRNILKLRFLSMNNFVLFIFNLSICWLLFYFINYLVRNQKTSLLLTEFLLERFVSTAISTDFTFQGELIALISFINSYSLSILLASAVILWFKFYQSILSPKLDRHLIVISIIIAFIFVQPYWEYGWFLISSMSLIWPGYIFYRILRKTHYNWIKRIINAIVLLICFHIFFYSPFLLQLSDDIQQFSLTNWVIPKITKPEKRLEELNTYLDKVTEYLSEENDTITDKDASSFAFRLWSLAPYSNRLEAHGIEIFNSAGLLIGRYGFFSQKILHPDLTDENELREPFPQTITLGNLTYRILTAGRHCSNHGKKIIILCHVEYYCFPLKTKLLSWPEYIPIQWFPPIKEWIFKSLIHLEYRSEVIYSSDPLIKIDYPHEPRFLAELNKHGFLWLKDFTHNGVKYNILYALPRFWGSTPDIIGFALPSLSFKEKLMTYYGFFILFTLFMSGILLLHFTGRVIRITYKVYKSGNIDQLFPTFRTKILIALIFISIIPLVIVMAIYKQTINTKLKTSIFQQSEQELDNSLQLLQSRAVIAARYIGDRFIKSSPSNSWSDEIDFDILHQQWHVISFNINDSQGFSLYEWRHVNYITIPVSDIDESQQAEAFHRGSPVFSYSRNNNIIILTVVVPLLTAERPDFPAGTIALRIAVSDRLLQKIAEDSNQQLIIYTHNQPLSFSDPSLHKIGLIPDLLNSSVKRILFAEQSQSLSSLIRGEKISLITSYRTLRDNTGRITAVLTGLKLILTNHLFHESRQLFRFSLYYLFPVILIVFLVGTYLSYRFYNPMKLLLGGTQKLASGDLSYRIPPVTDYEFSVLINSFNTMTEDLRNDRNTLERRRRYMEIILQNVTTGILVFDTSDLLTSMNNAAREILNIENENQFLNKPFLDLRNFKEMTFLRQLDFFDESPKPTINQLTISIGSKQKILQISISSFKTDEQSGNGWIIAIEDLTDLITSSRQAALVDMARQVAHEVKNPLTPIQLSAEHLLHTYEDRVPDYEKILKQCTTTIFNQVKNLRRITSEFSNFARLPEPVFRTENVNTIISDITLTSDVHQTSVGGKVIESALSPKLPLVLIDRGLIEQVILNLIKNALQATDSDGYVKISTGSGIYSYSGPITDDFKLGNDLNIWITIEDDGSGVDESHLLRIFEPYFSTKQKGFGLGLAICKRIITDHHGEIYAFSRKGIGTLFVIILPVHD